MKKILALVAVALVAIGSSFAAGIEGTWLDPNWNANWTLGVSADMSGKVTGEVVLKNAKTGKTIYTFTDKNTDDGFKLEVGVSGATLSFTCKKTLRSYKFTKGLTNTDLTLHIVPQWKQAEYEVPMKMVGNNVSVPDVKVEVPEVKVEVPEVQATTPSITVDSNGVNVSGFEQ